MSISKNVIIFAQMGRRTGCMGGVLSRPLSSKPDVSYRTTFWDRVPVKAELVPQLKKIYNKPWPLILKTSKSSRKSWLLNDWCNIVEEHKSDLVDTLRNEGVIVFRGFPITTPEHFDQFVKAFGFETFPYIGGISPRIPITGDVYTANEATPDKTIVLHHEMAYQPDQPNYVFFHCSVAPPCGGETPIVFSLKVYQKMALMCPKFVQKLKEEGVVYTRILPEYDDVGNFVGRGWRSTFEARNESEAEMKCVRPGQVVEWLPEGFMKITTRAAAFGYDSSSDQNTWFNHIYNFYKYSRKCGKNNGGNRHVQFGSGDPIPHEAMDKLDKIMKKYAVLLPWQPGDVMLLDNRLVLHGRQPYKPPRLILAALCS